MKKTREIHKVLVTVPYTGWHMDKLCKALAPAGIIFAKSNDADTIAKALELVDVAILGADLDARYVKAPKLKWVHCDHSGLNNSALPKVFEKGLLVTGSAGRSAPVLAEHALYFALSLIYKSPQLAIGQKNHDWNCVNKYREDRGLFGKTMGIIGLGYTGVELAKRARLFGMRVLGYRRSIMTTPEGVDKLYTYDEGDSIDELLKESDLVILTVRLSDETYHMIGEREFKIMKQTAFLINIARGPVVDENALVQALNDGDIAGAGADTFEIEPLPKESKLWEAPNMLITPHCTPEVPDLAAQSLEIICENIQRYRSGDSMINALVARDVYHQHS